MKVFKFGGASVRDAEGIRNLYEIVSSEPDRLVTVVSAFGKTTNALEEIHAAWREGRKDIADMVNSLAGYHLQSAGELGIEGADLEKIRSMFGSFLSVLESSVPGDFDRDYDMVVSSGEVWSTVIVEAFLRKSGLRSEWKDIRKIFLTDSRHRDAGILWDRTEVAVRREFSFRETDIYVTQGFIGSTEAGDPVTLGREGSDYTAAVLANMLDAEKVVVWKDVPGIMNADPKWLPDAVTLEHLSYNEAVEMTFSGAKVIHPKTIKPLHNKSIPLHVRSFADRSARGTIISAGAPQGSMQPVFVRKEKQILISVLPKDLSFVMGEHLAGLFNMFDRHGVKVNMVQAGAVSINICADHEEPRIGNLIGELRHDYTVLYNDGAEMITVRHCTPGASESVTRGMEVLISQNTRNTVRMVIRPLTEKS